MKAIVQTRYGSIDDLVLRDVPSPTPAAGEVLVRVHATSVHADMWHVVVGRPFSLRFMGGGFRRPENPIPGIDLSGTVEAAGPGATRFVPGDDVFGEIAGSAMLWRNAGTFAELVAVPERLLSPKPSNLSHVEAAAAPTAGLIAIQAVRDQGKVQAGHEVLVNGAGGGVGAFAVQVAKAFGAEVTAVDHPAKAAMLASLGADRVIDFTIDDFTRGVARYDAIIDIPVNHRFSEIRRVLKPDGRYVFIGHDGFGHSAGKVVGSLRKFASVVIRGWRSGHLPAMRDVTPTTERMELLVDLIESGQVVPVIDSTFPLDDTVAALHHLVAGNPCGKIVVTVADSAP